MYGCNRYSFLLLCILNINNNLQATEHNQLNENNASQTQDDSVNTDQFINESNPTFIRNVDYWIDAVHKSTLSGQKFKDENFNSYLHANIPLYLNENELESLYFAPGFNYINKRAIFNIGIGYRQLNPSETFFWGLNAFYDYDAKTQSQRVSQGFEMGLPYVMLSGNLYQGIGNWEKISEHELQKSANGYDATIELRLPFYSQITVSAQYFAWKGNQVNLFDGVGVDDPRGISYKLEYRPISLIGFSLQKTYEHHKKLKNTTLSIGLSYDFSQPISRQIAFNIESSEYDFAQKLFASVSRENNIYLKNRKITKPLINSTVISTAPNSDKNFTPDLIESEDEKENDSISVASDDTSKKQKQRIASLLDSSKWSSYSSDSDLDSEEEFSSRHRPSLLSQYSERSTSSIVSEKEREHTPDINQDLNRARSETPLREHTESQRRISLTQSKSHYATPDSPRSQTSESQRFESPQGQSRETTPTPPASSYATPNASRQATPTQSESHYATADSPRSQANESQRFESPQGLSRETTPTPSASRYATPNASRQATPTQSDSHYATPDSQITENQPFKSIHGEQKQTSPDSQVVPNSSRSTSPIEVMYDPKSPPLEPSQNQANNHIESRAPQVSMSYFGADDVTTMTNNALHTHQRERSLNIGTQQQNRHGVHRKNSSSEEAVDFNNHPITDENQTRSTSKASKPKTRMKSTSQKNPVERSVTKKRISKKK